MGANVGAGWTEDEVNLLKKMWDRGEPASRVCAAMARSRNAVIGKVHRLGLEKRGRGGNQTVKAAAKRIRTKKPYTRPKYIMGIATSPVPVAVAPVPPPQPVEGGVAIHDLELHHCRAVVGTGSDGLARFCGAHKESRKRLMDDSSYCQTHGDLYFTPRPSR